VRWSDSRQGPEATARRSPVVVPPRGLRYPGAHRNPDKSRRTCAYGPRRLVALRWSSAANGALWTRLDLLLAPARSRLTRSGPRSELEVGLVCALGGLETTGQAADVPGGANRSRLAIASLQG
jgi:hypothetical protein